MQNRVIAMHSLSLSSPFNTNKSLHLHKVIHVRLVQSLIGTIRAANRVHITRHIPSVVETNRVDPNKYLLHCARFQRIEVRMQTV